MLINVDNVTVKKVIKAGTANVSVPVSSGETGIIRKKSDWKVGGLLLCLPFRLDEDSSIRLKILQVTALKAPQRYLSR